MGIKIIMSVALFGLSLMCAAGTPENTKDREPKQFFMVLIFNLMGNIIIWGAF